MQTAEVSAITIPTDAGVFNALAAGPPNGTPVLLLHGFPQFSIQWSRQLETIGAHGYRAVAPDQRGYSPGARPAQLAEYATGHLVDDVLRIAGALGWGGFHLVGHDWGAAVAWATANAHPHRIRSVIPISVPHPGAFGRALRDDPIQRGMSAYMDEFRQPPPIPENNLLADFDRFGLPAHMYEYYYSRFATEPGLLTAALNWYRAAAFEKPVKTTVPTTFIAGTADSAVALSGIADTENWVQGPYRLELLEGVGHFVTEEAPEVASRLLLDHLGRVGPRPRA